ncbi:MAG: hypothetical protein GY703_01470 [Gammaproteobacteria bacterium]|nr:hypothetical protein [Gammaproteobacteria bacterium]
MSSDSPNGVFAANTGDEDLPISAAVLEDKYFARHYPGGGWICLNGDGYQGWIWAVDNAYTFPASNCSARTSDLLHPPVPTFVSHPEIISNGRGGPESSFSGPTGVIDVVGMVQRHQDLKGVSAIPVKIVAGTYSAPGRISALVKLTALDGTVRLE